MKALLLAIVVGLGVGSWLAFTQVSRTEVVYRIVPAPPQQPEIWHNYGVSA